MRLLEGNHMDHQLTTLRHRVYRRSLAKEIGVLEAIDELLVDIHDEQASRLLAQLRTHMEAYHRRCVKP
jgi:hypothetical protein